MKTKLDLTALNKFFKLVISVSVLNDAEGNAVRLLALQSVDFKGAFDGHYYNMKIENYMT